MNVLSLFDGMTCGQLALERASIKVDQYFASEIDPYAIKTTMKNYPNTIQLGDVKNWRNWNLPKIDLLIAGSPCQGFSMAGNQLNFEDPRSKLFFDFVDVKKALNPKNYLLENVKMRKDWAKIITRYMGIEPVMIDSALVSAQQRLRNYWSDIKIFKQPEDRKIYLKDVLEIENDEQTHDKILMTTADFQVKVRKHYIDRKQLALYLRFHKGITNKTTKEIADEMDLPKTHVAHWFRLDDSFAIPESEIWEQLKNVLGIKDNHYDKAITEFEIKNNNFDMAKRIYHINGKHPTLTTLTGGGQRKTITDGQEMFYLSPVHCERLQCVPDDFTAGVSPSQRFKMLGNGWTIDVVSHIFSFLPGAQL